MNLISRNDETTAEATDVAQAFRSCFKATFCLLLMEENEFCTFLREQVDMDVDLLQFGMFGKSAIDIYDGEATRYGIVFCFK